MLSESPNCPNGEPSLLVERPAAGVLVLALNRPACRNALDLATVNAMRRALGMLDELTERVVVLASSNPGMFCAGADLAVSAGERAEVSRALYGLYRQMIDSTVPVIAELDGPAVGGGAQLAIAADLRVASPCTWVRFVGPGHGLSVGAWGLPSLIGRGRAIDLCLTSRRVHASEALAIGLVDRVAPDPRRAALELASALATLDPDAVARTKRIVGRATACLEPLALEAEGNCGWSGLGPELPSSD